MGLSLLNKLIKYIIALYRKRQENGKTVNDFAEKFRLHYLPGHISGNPQLNITSVNEAIHMNKRTSQWFLMALIVQMTICLTVLVKYAAP